MTADQHIAQAATRAAIAYRNGDDLLGDYWTGRVEALSDQREAIRRRDEHCATFDVLKGHPDHSGHVNA
jgi:hypothetical protein